MEHFTKLLSKWLVFDGTDVSLSELEVHTDELFVNVKYTYTILYSLLKYSRLYSTIAHI